MQRFGRNLLQCGDNKNQRKYLGQKIRRRQGVVGGGLGEGTGWEDAEAKGQDRALCEGTQGAPGGGS